MNRLLWPIRLVGFVVWFVWQVLSSNLRVLWDSLTRTNRAYPHIVAFPTATTSAFEVSLLAISISLTPGTLVLATRRSTRFTLYVHIMYEDRASSLAMLHDMERRLLSAVRPGGLS